MEYEKIATLSCVRKKTERILTFISSPPPLKLADIRKTTKQSCEKLFTKPFPGSSLLSQEGLYCPKYMFCQFCRDNVFSMFLIGHLTFPRSSDWPPSVIESHYRKALHILFVPLVVNIIWWVCVVVGAALVMSCRVILINVHRIKENGATAVV